MKKYTICIIVLVFLLVLCLPFNSLAAGETTPFRSTVRGVIYGSSGSETAYAAPVYSVAENEFTIKTLNSYTGVNRLSFYFELPTKVSYFSITLTSLDSTLLYTQDGIFNDYVGLYMYSDGNFSSSLNITSNTTETKSTVDGLPTYTYQYSGGDSTRNCIVVSIPLSATVMGANSFYNFRVNNFSVNGIPINDIAVTETNAEFEDNISQLAQNEERMWAQVIAPDLTDALDRIQQQNNTTYNDYKAVISAVSIDNFLIPGLLMIVFSFAFYSYVIFGRKG